MARIEEWSEWDFADDEPSPMSLDDIAVDLLFIADALADHGLPSLANQIKRDIVPVIDGRAWEIMPTKVDELAREIKDRAKQESKKSKRKASKPCVSSKVSMVAKPLVELSRALSPKKEA